MKQWNGPAGGLHAIANLMAICKTTWIKKWLKLCFEMEASSLHPSILTKNHIMSHCVRICKHVTLWHYRALCPIQWLYICVNVDTVASACVCDCWHLQNVCMQCTCSHMYNHWGNTISPTCKRLSLVRHYSKVWDESHSYIYTTNNCGQLQSCCD